MELQELKDEQKDYTNFLRCCLKKSNNRRPRSYNDYNDQQSQTFIVQANIEFDKQKQDNYRKLQDIQMLKNIRLNMMMGYGKMTYNQKKNLKKSYKKIVIRRTLPGKQKKKRKGS